MEDVNWTKVVNHKKLKRNLKKKDVEKENIKWVELKNEIPHIILPTRAKRLQSKLNIDKLEYRLLSEEFIDYQRLGWKYVKVLKSSDATDIKPPSNTEETSYSILELNNSWGDCVLFKIDS
jgi:hypothetical protein